LHSWRGCGRKLFRQASHEVLEAAERLHQRPTKGFSAKWDEGMQDQRGGMIALALEMRKRRPDKLILHHFRRRAAPLSKFDRIWVNGLLDRIWLSLTFSDVYLLDRGDILENEITET